MAKRFSKKDFKEGTTVLDALINDKVVVVLRYVYKGEKYYVVSDDVQQYVLHSQNVKAND
jgi:hypothetical protein